MDSRRLAAFALADSAGAWTHRRQSRSTLGAVSLEDRRQFAPQHDTHRAAPLAGRWIDGASRIVGGVYGIGMPVIAYFDSKFRFPRTLKIAVGGDQRLPWGVVGTVDFLYTRGVSQFEERDVNLMPAQGTAAGEGRRALYGSIDLATGKPAWKSPFSSPTATPPAAERRRSRALMRAHWVDGDRWIELGQSLNRLGFGSEARNAWMSRRGMRW